MARNKRGQHPAKQSSSQVKSPAPAQRVRQEEAFPEAIEYQRTDYYAGPLPAPQAFFEYDQVLPGAAQRILAMAEKEQAHRHRLEHGVLRMESRNSLLGLIAGFILCGGVIGAGFYLVSQGADVAGAGVALAGLASLVAVFVVGRRSEPKLESSEKKAARRR